MAVSAGGNLKRTHLELGGKAPVIVFDDSDIASAAEGIATAGYFNAGQDCTAATRVFARAAVASDLTDALAEQAKGATTTFGKAADDEDAWVPPVNNINQMKSPRCRTAASSPRVTVRICRCTGSTTTPASST